MLDAGPLGLVTNPKLSPASVACSDLLQTLVGRGTTILLPEIADYEVRRESRPILGTSSPARPANRGRQDDRR